MYKDGPHTKRAKQFLRYGLTGQHTAAMLL